MNQFDRLETMAQRLIEGAFSRLFHTQLHPADLARHLAHAIENGYQEGSQNGEPSVPNVYHVTLSPADYDKMIAGSTVEAETARLRNYLIRLIQEVDGQSTGIIQVTLDQSAAVRPGKVRINSRYTNGNGTKPRTKTKEAFQIVDDKARRWLLHIDGQQIALGEPVFRIGRALDNDIVLSDQTVSRYHAQLRWRDGRYHLHPPVSPDIITEQEKTIRLDSPTTVNAQSVTHYPLSHDDTIKLGSTVLHVVIQSDP
ncbi:MAG: DUF3662 domain-containing protein [Anaerolineae bacterium]|nr:DUF3662 domain-containing protein [Anaerolineae bacterium]